MIFKRRQGLVTRTSCLFRLILPVTSKLVIYNNRFTKPGYYSFEFARLFTISKTRQSLKIRNWQVQTLLYSTELLDNHITESDYQQISQSTV